MIAHFISRSPCVICGHRVTKLSLSGTICVNKRSIRVTAQPFLSMIDNGRGYDRRGGNTCPECGSRDLTPLDRSPAALVPEVQAAVDAYRVKRWAPDAPATPSTAPQAPDQPTPGLR